MARKSALALLLGNCCRRDGRALADGVAVGVADRLQQANLHRDDARLFADLLPHLHHRRAARAGAFGFEYLVENHDTGQYSG
ncbi:MAG: hypothetical protein COZ20_00105 [Gallionellales bacterium CG_4_10_14_3_um_filter_54_96]|nr:MAG: hypothetical protein COZ20_00105 [Gallionellales bacterium CG_4_10_14_3_um_filter_54_96]